MKLGLTALQALFVFSSSGAAFAQAVPVLAPGTPAPAAVAPAAAPVAPAPAPSAALPAAGLPAPTPVPLAEPPLVTAPPAAPVVDQGPAPQPTAGHRHDGLYARLHLGAGYRSLDTKVSGGRVSATGVGMAFGAALGAAISENLILFGEVFTESSDDPTLRVNDATLGMHNASLSMTALGPGIAYYFMPSNVHIGASVLLAHASLESDGQPVIKTGWGVGGAAAVGKDFWLGPSFGLGLLGQLSASSLKDETPGLGATPTWKGVTASFALEATYN